MAGKTKGNQKTKSPPFVMLPKDMVQSRGYRSLSFSARIVLTEILCQYNGLNNGDLSATRTMAKGWGIASDNTLKKALDELQSAGWLVQTRDSFFSRHGGRCALYAVSWIPINDCPGKDLHVEPTKAPLRPLHTLLNSISTSA